ncbi:hypothetical protein [Amnibacterium setariae]|uniref:Cell division protein FtsL n=1 Tax=Amnibacterium setariae TaxID=2306585 RepID=A0A3A1U1I4_9MICO|nr:hypothetical protein [Amnibacterium setariae]RIX27657.1 hypothetical protein D1781_08830 [Amnibacterium setariae]
MSTAYAFDPVRRPGPVAPAFPVAAPPVVSGPVVAAPPAAAPRTRALAAPKVLAGAAVMGGVVCVVVAQLLLSIGTANGAYRLAELQQRSDVLARQQQVQAESLQALAAPQRLAARAAALGMVPDDSPAYLDARTGKVLGSRAATDGVAKAPGGIVR